MALTSKPQIVIAPTVADEAFDWRATQVIAQRCHRTRTDVTYTFLSHEDADRFARAIADRLGPTVTVRKIGTNPTPIRKRRTPSMQTDGARYGNVTRKAGTR